MTSDFGNVTLFPVIQVEATTNQAEATNYGDARRLLALGFWLLAKHVKLTLSLVPLLLYV
jgi:hypothetical protein